jgi:uracil-DNA glycosylase family 4
METILNGVDSNGVLKDTLFLNGKWWIPPRGDPRSKLMIVYSHPPFADIKNKQLCSEGDAADELKAALRFAGIPESCVWITSCVKHGIGNKEKPDSEEFSAGLPYLDAEIAYVKPSLILTLGAEAFKQVMGQNMKYGDFVGEIIDSPRGKLLANYSLGHVYNVDPKIRPEFQEIFVVARRFILGELSYTPFSYIVVDDPEVNKKIIQHYIDTKQLAVGYDAEWCGRCFVDEVMYTFQYSCEPHKAVILDISKDGKTENLELLKTMEPLLNHPEVFRLGWNIRADNKRLALRGIKYNEDSRFFDGMKAVAFFDSRWGKGLETGIRRFTDYAPYYNRFNLALREEKLDKQNMSQLKFIRPEIFYHYAGGDGVAHREACLRMHEELQKILPPAAKKFLYEHYLPLSDYLQDMEISGLPLDLELMEILTKQYTDKYNELLANLRSLVKPLGFDQENYERQLEKYDEKQLKKANIYPEFNPDSYQHKRHLLFTVLGLNPGFYSRKGKIKPRAWFEKQKENTQRGWNPSTGAKSLSTIKFELVSFLQDLSPEDPRYAEVEKRLAVVQNLLALVRVSAFSQKVFNKQGVQFEGFHEDEEVDEEEGLKTSYWAALCPDGKIHADFYECLDNFRSSSRPNVQNPASKVLSHIPDIFVPGIQQMEKAEADKYSHLVPVNIRQVFYAGKNWGAHIPEVAKAEKPGCWKFAEVDIAGADLAIAAFLSQDKDYIADIRAGNFHTTKMREYFQDPSLQKSNASKYVTAKSITFRVAYTAELCSAALPIQAEIFAESGIHVPLDQIVYALETWNRYKQYMTYRNRCQQMVDACGFIENAWGIRYYFEKTENFAINAGWKNQALAFPIASALALLMWEISVLIRKRLKASGDWLKWVYPVDVVHDANYWVIHEGMLKDNFFPELCLNCFSRDVKLPTGDCLGLEMVVSDRWKGKEKVFSRETIWNPQTQLWEWDPEH